MEQDTITQAPVNPATGENPNAAAEELALFAKVIEDGLAAAVTKLTDAQAAKPQAPAKVIIQAFEDELKPYWKSTTIVASGVGLFGFVAGLLGHNLLPSDLQLISDTITGSLTVAGYIGAIIGRLKASKVLH
jgi:hypothetical protein